MSCHLSRRLTPVHRAVSMALLYSVGLAAIIPSAQAATIGKTVVSSAQHEPLSASIVVTDIRAADFSASLANPVIYQQMGLTPTDSMQVRFQATSATSGQVLISTSQPVSKPFADLVLSINDNGQQNVVPKTLLMPLNDSLPINNASKNSVKGTQKLNLPSVSASTAKPLTVRKGAPPPLISVSNAATNKPDLANIAAVDSSISRSVSSIQTVTAISRTSNLTYAPSRLDNGRLNSDSDIKNTSSNANKTDNSLNSANRLDSSFLNANNNTETTKAVANDSNKASVKNTPILDKVLIDKPLDTLNIQVTRQIQPSRKKTDTDTSPVSTPTTSIIASNTEKNATSVLAASIGNATSKTPKSAISNVPSDDRATDSSTVNQYQVQRNDSLWIIAQQIAQENNLDTSIVMKQIQSQNPDAFINKDADQLKADAKLILPSYDVIPSQKNLEAAIDAQRQYIRRANTAAMQKTAQRSFKKPSINTQAAKRPEKATTTKTQTLSKAQFSVLASGRDGNADGTQAKAASNTGNGLSTDILETLKASRQQAASQAQRLSSTSSTLSSYTKKIQLQNQKLAELQARLEKLRNQ
ncbi:peptigoglycan-binding protein LysM [Psychrobacter sp. APC 3281]|uniref:type IV pilus assembly protein FimV n=1 Tax=Psychrobacter sp. APC 3281 TaxID=3035190 RepID=UPI0025B342AD|nr:peptigoglycan-binding protein LysM [Psychrobacter sp. APC 3281]MDN3446843.1 peptigoglycan-binding protein LysM [Psychrobacter sp. APC 3281]